MLYARMTWALVLMLLNVVDYHTTWLFIQDAGSFEAEANPILRVIMELTGTEHAMLGVKVMALALWFSLIHHIPMYLHVSIVMIYFWVCMKSLLVLYGGM